MTASAKSEYAFDNDHEAATAHHNALAGFLDVPTRNRITALATNWPNGLAGLHVAEIAGGAGSIAYWLADQVGADGKVVVTDIKPSLIDGRSNLTVRTHDILTGPIPEEPYDLIHVRALLNHLAAGRYEALKHMIFSMKPGGVLLCEDLVPVEPDKFVVDAPTPADASLLRLLERVYLGILSNRGSDRTWSHRAPNKLAALGLCDVQKTVFEQQWTGGDPGPRLLIAAIAQLRSTMIHDGLAAEDLDQVRELLDNPRVVLKGHALHSVSGWLAGPGHDSEKGKGTPSC